MIRRLGNPNLLILTTWNKLLYRPKYINLV
nr:MAG TPA: hypothetical protein [Caudoviricetes sp.]